MPDPSFNVGYNIPKITIPGDVVADGVEHTQYVDLSAQGGAPAGVNLKDSITFTTQLNDQVTVSGKLSFYENGVKITYSLSPSNPSGPTPPGDKGHPESLPSNDWFKVSFVAVFSAIMAEVLDSLKQTHFSEAQMELKSRTATLDIAKSLAAIAIDLANLRSAQTLMDAISSFVSAAINFGALCGYAKLSAKVNKMEDVQKAKGELDTRQKAFDNIFEQKVGNDPAALAASKKKFLENPHAQEYEGTPEKAAYDNMLEAKKNYGQIYNNAYTQAKSENETVKEMAESVNRGTASVIKAFLQKTEGPVEALQKLLDGYMNIMRTFTDNSAKHRDDAASAFNEANRLLQQIVDSFSRSMHMGAG